VAVEVMFAAFHFLRAVVRAYGRLFLRWLFGWR
jgi:hypothetical protein